MTNKVCLGVPAKYEKLIKSVRTAYATEYSLDK
jgi:hypothetical protein